MQVMNDLEHDVYASRMLDMNELECARSHGLSCLFSFGVILFEGLRLIGCSIHADWQERPIECDRKRGKHWGGG